MPAPLYQPTSGSPLTVDTEFMVVLVASSLTHGEGTVRGAHPDRQSVARTRRAHLPHCGH